MNNEIWFIHLTWQALVTGAEGEYGCIWQSCESSS